MNGVMMIVLMALLVRIGGDVAERLVKAVVVEEVDEPHDRPPRGGQVGVLLVVGPLGLERAEEALGDLPRPDPRE